MATGFEGYQSKPLHVKAFVEAVRQMLDRTSEPPPPDKFALDEIVMM